MDTVVVITGGGRGLGLGIAERFVRLQAKAVIIIDIKLDYDNLKDELNIGEKQELVLFQVDCLAWDDLKQAFDKIAKKFDSIDYLFCNAAKVANVPVDLMKGDCPDFELIESHIRIPLNTLHAGVPLLAKSSHLGKAAVVTCSLAGIARYHLNPHYCIGKHGSVGVVHSYANLCPPGVRLIGVAPGFVKVASVEALFAKRKDIEASAISLTEAVDLFIEAIKDTKWSGGQVLYKLHTQDSLHEFILPAEEFVPK